MASLASMFKDLGSEEKDGLLDDEGYMSCLGFSLEYRRRSCVITNENKWFLVVVDLGGLFEIRNQIVDVVIIARILEASLVLTILNRDERLVVERAVREAHELALAEAREGVALERVNEEFRQRMIDDALEKVAKASLGTQSTSKRTSARSKHRVDCSAVDRQRALEKAASQKIAADFNSRESALRAKAK
uniref:GDP-fucose protein O-fucosyltransferase n=1 Tax=Tanacetum cinerariifolium TaxID=118510 RepID=A0A699HGH1_TANCI|nr:GDP-fucose protein O-fucosyltransferase [Tanacetum cinerariifolium]